MKEIKSVELKADTVTVVVIERDYYGTVRSRRQMTFRRRNFEAALRAAEVTVPWQDVAR